jgi:hypothetical protein
MSVLLVDSISHCVQLKSMGGKSQSSISTRQYPVNRYEYNRTIGMLNIQVMVKRHPTPPHPTNGTQQRVWTAVARNGSPEYHFKKGGKKEKKS